MWNVGTASSGLIHHATVPAPFPNEVTQTQVQCEKKNNVGLGV